MFNNFDSNTPRAPMRAESYKRFSLYKKVQKRSFWDYLFDWIVKGILVGLLVSINFVMFSSSSNYSLFAEGLYVIPHIILPVMGIFALLLGIMFLISFSSTLENLFVCCIVGLFAYATVNQFMMLSPDSFLYSIFYNMISPQFAMNFVKDSDVIAAVSLAVITLLLLIFLSKRTVFIAALLLAVIFGIIIADEYINHRNKEEFVTVYDLEHNIEGAKGNKFVYIMLPTATSYRYLYDMEKEKIAIDELKKTQDLMLGFFANNDFTLYQNAYVENEDKFMNIVDQFNILNNKKGEEALLDNVIIDGYLKFKNHNEKHVYLEENKLFNNFKDANYKINVYQSHGIELCHSNNQVIADKCVEKQSRPFNFDKMKLSEAEKTKLLLLQWADSTALFNDLSGLYGFLNSFTDAGKIALVGIPYNDLYVINSIKTLDIMFKDMLSESGNATYFAMIDMPNDMYVYGEFCNIKPSSEWLSKENLPWIKTPNLYARKKAYLEQTNCMYGKLQEFMNRLKESGLDENTVVVVQGINGFDDAKEDGGFIRIFRSKKAVVMGIREPKVKKFVINNDLCPTSSILIEYLYGKATCQYFDAFKIADANKVEFSKDINSLQISNGDIARAGNSFTIWYKDWAEKADTSYIKFNQKEESEVEPSETVTEDRISEVVEEVKEIETTQEIIIEEPRSEEELPVKEEEVPVVAEEENFFMEESIEAAPEAGKTEGIEKAVNAVADENELLSIELDDIMQ